MTKLHNILREVANAFCFKRRHDGVKYVTLKDGVDDDGACPDFMKHSNDTTFMLEVHQALDGRGPDDWVYEQTWHLAQDLANSAEYHSERSDDEWDPEEAVDTVADSQTEVYTMPLLQWLSSNLHNHVICDEIAEEQGLVGIIPCVTAGQHEALRRIAMQIVELCRAELNARTLEHA